MTRDGKKMKILFRSTKQNTKRQTINNRGP